MEDGLRDELPVIISIEDIVLILVVMEDGLRVYRISINDKTSKMS